MKKAIVILNMVLVLLATLIIIFLENVIDDFFIAPIIECVFIFSVVLFIKWISDEDLFGVTILTTVLFFSFETIVYLLSVKLGFIQSSMYDVFSWRIVYGLFFTFIWIPITIIGLKYKQKSLWFLFLALGCLVHLIINLVMTNF